MHADPTQAHGPYIITTKRSAHGFSRSDSVERRAVATLGEARRWVTRSISDSGRKAGSTDYVTAATMGPGGCSLGPLPDGRVVEVERKALVEVAYLAGMRERWLRGCRDRAESLPSAEEIIAAYNAAQETP